MKNKDLETGMVAELRNGDRYIVVAGEDFAIGIDVKWEEMIVIRSSVDTCNYNSDLTHKSNKLRDIVAIFTIPGMDFTRMMWSCKKPIWERKEPKKMTVSEICKELGYEVEIVRDDS